MFESLDPLKNGQFNMTNVLLFAVAPRQAFWGPKYRPLIVVFFIQRVSFSKSVFEMVIK